jgi:hypothetical protein
MNLAYTLIISSLRFTLILASHLQVLQIGPFPSKFKIYYTKSNTILIYKRKYGVFVKTNYCPLSCALIFSNV